MTFFSVEFAFCFILFFAVYWLSIKKKFLNSIILLAFNFLFLFSFSPFFALFNLFFGVIVYIFGIFCFGFSKTKKRKGKKSRSKFIITLSLGLVIFNLCFFKYHDFLKEHFSGIVNFFEFSFSIPSELLFPIGLSFYTFNAVSYLVSAYKKEISRPGFIETLVYFSFFAILVCGPIFRAKEFFKAYKNRKWLEGESEIFALITLAVFKKLLLANYLSTILPPIFADPASYTFFELVFALVGFSFMLYFDFSGYVNLVSAFGLMVGIRLPINFNKPFTSRSIKEFWARWHISLSSFIKDYIYIPLGGNRGSKFRTNLNVFIAFFLSGIWHGNTLNFAIWGILHAFGVIFMNLTKNIDLLKFDFLKRFFTFVFVSFTWLFFAIREFDQSIFYLENLFIKEPILDQFAVICLVGTLLFIYLYTKIEILSFIENIYSKIPLFLYPVIFLIIALVVYIFIPSGMPGFIYQEF